MAHACFKKSISLPIEAQGLRVLLVEHDVNYMNHMTKVLEQHSWKVTPMEHASVALSLVYETTFDFDLVIYEIDMPGLNGFNFMERAMSKQVPVILTSWRGEESLAKKAINQGASFFLQKPIVDQYLANVSQHVCHFKLLEAKRIKLNYDQSSTRPWATPHSTTSALTDFEEIATQHVSGRFKGKKDGKKLMDLQSVGFSGIEKKKSRNQLGKGFFPQIIHDMCLYSNEPILEQNSGTKQENSCWNMLVIAKSPCMKELETSLAMRNSSSSLLGNYNMEEQVNTGKLIEFNYGSNNNDTCLFGNEEVPNESSQNEIDDETKGLLSYYGYLNCEGNCQSGSMTQAEAPAPPPTVEQGEGNPGIFGGQNETFENFIDHQFVDHMEMFYNSFDDASNKDIMQVLKEDA